MISEASFFIQCVIKTVGEVSQNSLGEHSEPIPCIPVQGSNILINYANKKQRSRGDKIKAQDPFQPQFVANHVQAPGSQVTTVLSPLKEIALPLSFCFQKGNNITTERERGREREQRAFHSQYADRAGEIKWDNVFQALPLSNSPAYIEQQCKNHEQYTFTQFPLAPASMINGIIGFCVQQCRRGNILATHVLNQHNYFHRYILQCLHYSPPPPFFYKRPIDFFSMGYSGVHWTSLKIQMLTTDIQEQGFKHVDLFSFYQTN